MFFYFNFQTLPHWQDRRKPLTAGKNAVRLIFQQKKIELNLENNHIYTQKAVCNKIYDV